LDNDGDLDIVTANYDDNDISIALGDGNGGFTITHYSGGLDDVREPKFVDVDNDNDLDVIGVSQDDHEIFVFYNIGAGVFDNPTTYPVGGLPGEIDAGDLNGDGFVDLAMVVDISNTGEDKLRVLFNNGNGTFGTPWTGTIGSVPLTLRIFDFNQDNIPDIATASSTDVIQLFANDGAGGLTLTRTIPMVGTILEDLEVGDFDGDNDMDIAVFDRADEVIEVLLNSDGAGDFIVSGRYPCGAGAYHLQLVDIDNDGHLDLISSNSTGNRRAIARYGVGSGLFSEIEYLGGAAISTDIAFGDFDSDGMLDLVAVRSATDSLYLARRICGDF